MQENARFRHPKNAIDVQLGVPYIGTSVPGNGVDGLWAFQLVLHHLRN